jgi:Zn-dependent M28 family amino/carboxypeptidase
MLYLEQDTRMVSIKSPNIIVETIRGNSNKVIAMGSHLDGVHYGAGINDNGSGSSLVLETAIQMARNNVNVQNKIRFAWWSLEE